MRHFYKDPDTYPLTGSVYEYDSPEMRAQFGPANLVVMSPVEVESHLNPIPAQDPVPTVVTMRQAQLALFSAGLLNQVDSFIESLPEPDRTQAWIEWNKSSEMHRHRPLVKNIGMALGLSEAQIDDLFIAAAGIE